MYIVFLQLYIYGYVIIQLKTFSPSSSLVFSPNESVFLLSTSATVQTQAEVLEESRESVESLPEAGVVNVLLQINGGHLGAGLGHARIAAEIRAGRTNHGTWVAD